MKKFQTWHTRFLITIVALGDAHEDTLRRVYALIRWSFEVLFEGIHPHFDPFGNEWTDSVRRERELVASLMRGTAPEVLSQTLPETGNG